MRWSWITLQLSQHATPVRHRSQRRSPTKPGDTRGSCVLCLCYVGEERHIQTLESCYLITQCYSHRHTHSKHVDLWMIPLSQVGVGMLPHSIFPKPLQGRLSHLSSLSTGSLCTQEDVQCMKGILNYYKMYGHQGQSTEQYILLFKCALCIRRHAFSCHVKHFKCILYVL